MIIDKLKKLKQSVTGRKRVDQQILRSSLDPRAKKELLKRWMTVKGLKETKTPVNIIITIVLVTQLIFTLTVGLKSGVAIGIATLCGVATYFGLKGKLFRFGLKGKLFRQDKSIDILSDMRKRIELKKIVGKMYRIYKSVFFKYFEHFGKEIRNGNPTLALMRFKQYPEGIKQLKCVDDEKCQRFYDVIKKMRFRPNYKEKTIQYEDIKRAKNILNELVEEFKGDLMRDDI